MIRDHIIKSAFNEMIMIFQDQAHNHKVDVFVKIKKWVTLIVTLFSLGLLLPERQCWFFLGVVGPSDCFCLWTFWKKKTWETEYGPKISLFSGGWGMLPIHREGKPILGQVW